MILKLMTDRVMMFVTLLAILAGLGHPVVASPASLQDPADPQPAVVRNGAESSDGFVTLQLHELWRASADNDAYLFGLIHDAMQGRDGRIYLVDTQLADVKMFSASGSYMGTLSRYGEGPGETESPSAILRHPESGIGILQPFPPKIVWLDEAGNSQGDFRPARSDGGNLGGMYKARCRQGRLLASLGSVRVKDGRYEEVLRLCRFDLDGNIVGTYIEAVDRFENGSSAIDERQNYSVFRGLWDLDSRGRVFSARERDRYCITVQDSLGAVNLVIEREYTRRRRTDKERQRLDDRIRRRSHLPEDATVVIDEFAPVIRSLRIAAGDELWVQPDLDCDAQPAGLMAVYDVFSPQGKYVRRVNLMGDGDCVRDNWFFVGENRLILVKEYYDSLMSYWGPPSVEGADDAPVENIQIICYALSEGN